VLLGHLAIRICLVLEYTDRSVYSKIRSV